MAATKTVPTKLQQEQTRSAIQTTQLIKRLQNYALGQKEANASSDDAPAVELDAGRLRAIEILLRKSLPDLQAVQISGTGSEGELVVQIERTIVKASN